MTRSSHHRNQHRRNEKYHHHLGIPPAADNRSHFAVPRGDLAVKVVFYRASIHLRAFAVLAIAALI
jgi:hypothetical protein